MKQGVFKPVRKHCFKGVWGLVVCVMVAVGPSSMAQHTPKERDKVLSLQKQIQLQNKMIQNLKQELREIKRNSLLSPHPINTPQPPKEPSPPNAMRVEKLLPEDQTDLIEKDELDKILGLEEVSVADSSQEIMHFYYQALHQVETGKYEAAVGNLKKFLELSPSHVYADRAQFLMGDAYFKAKEYNLSVLASSSLEARFPYSIKLPESLYYRGLAFIQLDQREYARTTFENLIQKFPASRFVEEAKKSLGELNRQYVKKQVPPLLGDVQ